MCTVQVLLFTDVTRRPRATPFEVAPAPRRVCRRLFADDSNKPRPAALLKTLEANLEREVKERWNFDFRSGLPLPGRYQWVRPGQPLSGSEVRLSESVSDEQTTGKQTSGKQMSGKQTSSRGSPSRNQAKITDFLQQRKRSAATDSESPKLKSRRLSTSTGSVDVTTST